MPVIQTDLDWVVSAFGQRQTDYAKARKYYGGDHDLAFATPKFQSTFGSLFKSFAYNRCASVVDAMANALTVQSFSVRPVDIKAGLVIEPEPGAGADPAADLGKQAWALWQLAGMHLREGEIYTEAGLTGDSYAVVWYDAEPPWGTGLPRMWPNKADVMRVKYDDNGRIMIAAKSWLVVGGPDDKKRRLTFYTPTEIIKYITKDKAEAELPKALTDFTLYAEVNALNQTVINPVIHNLGIVPVVHYTNNAPMAGDFGISELRDVIPLQDALNKSIADMLVAMEYNAYPQRYAIGIETPQPTSEGKIVLPWKAGAGEVWYTTRTRQEAEFGTFEASQLAQFLDVQNQFDTDISRVSHIPVHWLIMTGTPPSGESLKTAEAPFSAKKRDRQRSHGAGHALAVQIMFRLMGIADPLIVIPEWESAEPRSQRDQAEIGKMMADAGVPIEIAAKVMGLDENDLAIIAAKEAESAASRESAMAQLTGNAMASQLESDNAAAIEA